jgi:hypothetical protein
LAEFVEDGLEVDQLASSTKKVKLNSSDFSIKLEREN